MSAGLDRQHLLSLISHAGNMCLLDKVTTHTALDIECTTRTHADTDHPLRRDGQLSALHLVEFAAQAMAVHGALLSGGAQRGMLAAVRKIELNVDRIDTIEGELTIHAIRRITQDAGWLYDFSVRASGRLLGRGRIAIAFF